MEELLDIVLVATGKTRAEFERDVEEYKGTTEKDAEIAALREENQLLRDRDASIQDDQLFIMEILVNNNLI
jgi:hypothetical protein